MALNRPHVRNAINRGLHWELGELFQDVVSDRDSDVIVLTGEGKAFCAGGDLLWMQQALDDPSKFEDIRKEAKRILFGQLELEKPVIARLSGPATGLGAC